MTPERFFMMALLCVSDRAVRTWALKPENRTSLTAAAGRFLAEKGESVDPRRFSVYLVTVSYG